MKKEKEEILRTIREEASLAHITKKYNLRLNTLKGHLHKLGIRVSKEIKAAKIRKALEGGVGSMRELCSIINQGSASIKRICEEYNIKLPFKPEYVVKDRIPELDRLIAQFLPTPEISIMTKRSRQAVDQYIRGSGQYGFWKAGRKMLIEEARNEQLKEKNLREKFYNLMVKKVFQLARKEGWSTEMAIYYYLIPRTDKRKLKRMDMYKKAFSVYEQAVLNDEKPKPTLEILARRSGFKWPMCIGRIYKSIGLKPFYKPGQKSR